MYNKNKNQAKKLLIYYFKTLFERTGLYFDQDNENEITEIIDCIFEVISSNE